LETTNGVSSILGSASSLFVIVCLHDSTCTFFFNFNRRWLFNNSVITELGLWNLRTAIGNILGKITTLLKLKIVKKEDQFFCKVFLYLEQVFYRY